MKQLNFLSAALLAAAVVIATPAANATTVKVLGAGSSAMWQTAAIGAFNQLAGAGAQHFTIKGTCTSGANCAQIHDSRLATIFNETGNLWVVWNSTETEVWAYISVDSVVGNRAYFAVPRTTLQLDPMTENGGFPSGDTNLIASGLWGLDAAVLPASVYTALNNASITTAFTDIRPEDAKYASCRVLDQLNATTYLGLGYGTGTTCTTQQGTSILSDFSTATANPVNYNIKGTDPITGKTVPKFTSIDVGATPVVFIVNRSNPNGLGYGGTGTPSIVDLTVADAQGLWNGTECDTNQFGGSPLNIIPPTDTPVYVMEREPMSGTMNTTEFSLFRCGTSAAGNYTGAQCQVTGTANEHNSQEKHVVPANGAGTGPGTSMNPLDLTCLAGGGTRQRAIGTGEMDSTAVYKTTDSIGYTFWGFGNVSKLAGSADYGYLTLDGVDPIQAIYTNGELPVCISGGVSGVCPATPGTTFPNLRNGTYKAWSMLRVVTNASGVALTNTVILVNAIQNNVNTTVPDFVPYGAVGGDPGMKYYRSHYTQSGYGPNNGLSGETETGGDMGGCIEPVGSAPGVTGCHQ